MDSKYISFLIVITLFCMLFAMYELNHITFSEKVYVSSVYLYIFFGIVTILFFNEFKLVPEISSWFGFFVILILSFGLIYLINITSSQSMLQFICWIGFLYLMAIVINRAYNISKDQGLFNQIAVTIVSMCVVMTIIAYNFNLNNTIYSYLYVSLIGIIVASIMNMAFSSNYTNFINRNYIISIISILVFNGLLIYDTKTILNRGKQLSQICPIGYNCGNYIPESLNVTLDILNLFSSLVNTNYK